MWTVPTPPTKQQLKRSIDMIIPVRLAYLWRHGREHEMTSADLKRAFRVTGCHTMGVGGLWSPTLSEYLERRSWQRRGLTTVYMWMRYRYEFLTLCGDC
ncbi:hypothetical protein BGZ60DRAFT_393632 [Tricladium varicosporioides]|nr:hypothetical protein BGZ60DRAFT_393632 [Hymenoscyphus varicosporioides]